MARTLWPFFRSAAKRVVFGALGVTYKLDRTAGRSVLLTFDDGPHPEVTPGVLDRLRSHGALAVFFVVGNRIPRAPEMLARTTAEGHLIGNHTYDHWLDHTPWPPAYMRDIRRCQEVIGALTAQTPWLFRPPLGRISPASWLAARAAGLSLVHWSLDSKDWRLRRETDAEVRGEELSRVVRHQDIILFHDDNPCVLTVLDVLLPRLRSEGFDLNSPVRRLISTARNGAYDRTRN
jgi:peptidoglycan/xylan/chitin deacetylase (PgdA/CDA1 family)